MRGKSEAHITRDQVAEIVKRATELDSADLSLFTEAELREIASEVGINDATVNQALHEFLSLHSLGSGPKQTPRPAWIQLKSTFFAVATGAVVMLAANGRDWIPMPFWLPFVIPLYFALRSKGLKPNLTFQLQNAGYWLGITSTYMLVGRIVSSEVAEMMMAAIPPTAVLGGLIVLAKHRWLRLGTNTPGSERQSSIQSFKAESTEGGAARRSLTQWWLDALNRRSRARLMTQPSVSSGAATATP